VQAQSRGLRAWIAKPANPAA